MNLSIPTCRESYMSEPVVIVAHISYIDCPICSVPVMGFVNDPSGGTFKCDSCEQNFEVPLDEN